MKGRKIKQIRDTKFAIKRHWNKCRKEDGNGIIVLKINKEE